MKSTVTAIHGVLLGSLDIEEIAAQVTEQVRDNVEEALSGAVEEAVPEGLLDQCDKKEFARVWITRLPLEPLKEPKLMMTVTMGEEPFSGTIQREEESDEEV